MEKAYTKPDNAEPMELSPEMTKVVYDTTYYLAFHATKAVLPFLQRDSYLYWPFLLSYLALCVAVWGLSVRLGWGATLRDYFGSRVWWHRSARADYVLYFANALLMPLLASWLLMKEPAWNANAGSTSPAHMIAFTVLFFVAYDFGRFVSHCLLHDVPWLWEFHKIHHSAEVLTPMTSFRAHPFELLLMAWGSLVMTSALAWGYNLLFPGAVGFFTFLGLHVFFWGFNLIDNLRHSPVWFSYGPRIGKWLISPAQHQLHHSCEPRHFGCNRGFNIALWDRLYGTLYVPGFEPEKFRLGLGDGTEARYHGLARMYFLPFVEIARRLELRRA
jgi:sterol desaturase/sphingolipid hydroxylase (fatty acid hydroxylase superfamily)